jgi:hypothetical protein
LLNLISIFRIWFIDRHSLKEIAITIWSLLLASNFNFKFSINHVSI